MKLIKLAIISITVLFFILTCMGLLLPSTVRVTRTINIVASQDTLYKYVGNVSNWQLWMEGINTNTIQFVSSQSIEKNGVSKDGKQQIYIVKNSRDTVETIWQNKNGKTMLCVFQLSNNTASNTTKLNWYFEQKLSWYPWQRLSAIASDKIFGPFMEESLDKLKAITEHDKN